MNMRIGTDIVPIEEFTKSTALGREKFLYRVFSEEELNTYTTIESRAGVFAAKEAIMKAFNMSAGKWHSITITKGESGKPKAYIDKLSTIITDDLSISHTKEYALAVYAALLSS